MNQCHKAQHVSWHKHQNVNTNFDGSSGNHKIVTNKTHDNRINYLYGNDGKARPAKPNVELNLFFNLRRMIHGNQFLWSSMK